MRTTKATANAKVNASELVTTDFVNHTTYTGEHPPIWQHRRDLPFALRNQVMQMMQDMLDRKILQLSSSLVVLVEKSFRLSPC